MIVALPGDPVEWSADVSPVSVAVVGVAGVTTGPAKLSLVNAILEERIDKLSIAYNF
jgi:hypothetical protein